MTQTERRRFLLSSLLAEAPEYQQLAVPDDAAGQKQLLRALLNVRPPRDASPEYAWIRLHGKAVFENNMAAKEMCIANPIVKGQYGEATNPIFEVFYLEDAHGAIADFSGNPPYEF